MRILLVEDDAAVAAAVAALLREEGLHVDIVHTGGAAEGAVDRCTPDAVVLDYGLPDLNGREVYQRIRRRWPELAVLFVSGDRPPLHDLIEAAPTRTAFLPKPCDGPALIGILRRLTASR